MDENRNETTQVVTAEPISPAGNPTATTALVLSIIAAVLCEWPVGSIAAIVLAALALPRANKALARANAGGGKKPMAVIAKVLSIVALVLGIIFTVVWLVSFIAGLAAAGTVAASEAYSSFRDSLSQGF